MNTFQRFIFSKAGIWILFITWTLFITNLWLPRNWGFYGNGDWDLTYSTFEAARISIVGYGEWPSYQPFLAFGSDLNANPQAVHASVFFIPVLLFGSFYGYKASILLAILIGLWGCYRLFLKINQDRLTAISMAFIFCGAPYFSRHIFDAGHSNFLYFYFLPWLLYALYQYNENPKPKYYGLTVLLLVFCLTGGAPIAFLLFALCIFIWNLGLFLSKQTSHKKSILNLSGIFWALLLCAWKIIPAIQFWQTSPRHVNDDSGINLLVWLQSLLDIQTDHRTPHDWHELSIGFPLILLFISLVYIKKLPHYKLWIGLCLPLIWIGFGNMPDTFNPWYLLHHYFPFINSLRAPYRIGVLSLATFSVLFVYISKYLNHNGLVYIILMATALTQTLSYNAISKNMVFSDRIEELNQKNTAPLTVHRLQPGDKQFIHTAAQHLIPNAYEPLHLPEVNDSLETFVKGGKINMFRPSQIALSAFDSMVLIHLRYSKNWTLKGEGEIVNSQGLLAVKQGGKNIELTYSNPVFKKCLAYSALALFGFLAFLFFIRPKQA